MRNDPLVIKICLAKI